MREVLIHVKLQVDDSDERSPDEIADDVLQALRVSTSDNDKVHDLNAYAPLGAEEDADGGPIS